MLTASAVWWETGCQQISSGSTSQNTTASKTKSEYSIGTDASRIHYKEGINEKDEKEICFIYVQIPAPLACGHKCHFWGYLKWVCVFSKYSQLHFLILLEGPLCLADHQSLWCSELETPSPILFLWHWWRTCTGASSPAQEQSGKDETTITFNT